MNAGILLAIEPYLGYIIFGAVAALLALCIVLAVIFTLRKNRRTEKTDILDKYFPDVPEHYDFINELGFDPFSDPAGEPQVENADPVIRAVELFRQSIAFQERCRRRIEILNYVYDTLKAMAKTAKDVAGFLPKYLDSLSDGTRAAGLKQADAKAQTMHAFAQRHAKDIEEKLTRIANRRETHLNDVAAAVESLRTRIITDEYVIFDRRSDLMALRPDTDEGRAEAENAKEYYSTAIRHSALMPLLVSVNRAFVEIGRIEIMVSELENQRIEMLQKAEKRAEAASTKDKSANKRMRAAYVESESAYRLRAAYFAAYTESLLERKRLVIETYMQHKRAADSYLNAEHFSLNEIVFSEDRVIGQIAYESTRKRMLSRQRTAWLEFTEAEGKYNDLLQRKMYYKKGAGRSETPYDKRVQDALERVKRTRAERIAADGDVETDLPHLNPIALIVSGSGVISRELLAAKAKSLRSYDSYIADALETVREYEQHGTIRHAGDPEQYFESSAPMPMAEEESPAPEPEDDGARYVIDREAMAQQLEEMEREAERALPPSRPAKTADPESPEFIEQIQRRIQALMRMRRSMKYIDTPKESAEFKRKVKAFERSLSETEKQNAALSELIRRTYSQVEYLGDKDAPV